MRTWILKEESRICFDLEHIFTACQSILFAELLSSKVSFSHVGFEFSQILQLYGVAETGVEPGPFQGVM
jgi:hypothetical protein